MKTNGKALRAMSVYGELSIDIKFIEEYIREELQGDAALLEDLLTVERILNNMKYRISPEFLNKKEMGIMEEDEILERITDLIG